ncbi:MAG TPA: hypothetical protein GX735_07245 [Firmicutes bacterium]|jgi:hypothetical protein|nr:hypothetical protein [Bacillota bacterium]
MLPGLLLAAGAGLDGKADAVDPVMPPEAYRFGGDGKVAGAVAAGVQGFFLLFPDLVGIVINEAAPLLPGTLGLPGLGRQF